jgi:hypothetical protein
MRPLA